MSTYEPGLRATTMDFGQSGLTAQPLDRFDGDDPTWAIAAKQPLSPAPAPTLESIPAGGFKKGFRDTQGRSVEAKPQETKTAPQFVPWEPKSLDASGLRVPQIEALVLKFLLNSGGNTGREIAQQIALPFVLVEPLLRGLKDQQLISYRSGTALGDYQYELTPRGNERARSYVAQSTYFGSAPVTLEAYRAGVEAQSIRHQKPRIGDVKRAFRAMVLGDQALRQLGEAVNLGLGFFLHGPPGNGKTTIAEFVTSVFSKGLWIPRAIQAGGEIIRVFDPTRHQPLEFKQDGNEIDQSRPDGRWVYIKRPTLLVGGELRLENFEVTTNPVTGISEAPIQLKSNCGTLVIDDFGRQKFQIDQLLNRLIVPLERRIDVLNLPSGRSFQVPFDLLVVFSTNLDPEALVDEAFLRRVPFTIPVVDPTEAQFRDVFQRTAAYFGLEFEADVVTYLIDQHYRQAGRPMRFCHPRDILQQVHNSCDFLGLPKQITPEILDQAIQNCLAIRARS